MSSRESILKDIFNSQPEGVELPSILIPIFHEDRVATFIKSLTGIGGEAWVVKDYDEIIESLSLKFGSLKQVFSDVGELSAINTVSIEQQLHAFEQLQLFVTEAPIAVAENGAVYLKERAEWPRVLPFICEHLAVVLRSENIFPFMHDAYEHIGEDDYGFAVFIAGPSKTADIEQSLVLGAHGPKTMTVYII